MISEVERIWKEIVKYYTGSHVEWFWTTMENYI
jgi:hypothetical protein